MMNTTSATASWTSFLDESKRGLAKLLARENISVRHANVSTASFNIETRELLLPYWENITVDQYDLLIGHEVGHALYTDNLDLLRDVDAGLHSYINVLEDTRIERRIKDAFPGLKGAFTRGYADFVKNGPIFNDATPERVREMDLIDRINVHYKIGAHIAVPFTTAEHAILKRVDALRTFEDAVNLAKELHAAQAQQNAQKPKPTPQPGQGQGQDQQSGQGAGRASESSSQPTPGQGAGEGQPSNADQGDGQPSNADQGDGQTPAPSSPSAQTDQANANALKSLTRKPTNGDQEEQVMLGRLSDGMIDHCVESVDQFTQTMIDHLTRHQGLTIATERYQTFKTAYAPTIAHMAREFERRKTAKLMERARTARTGRIDVTKLASYKFREDLFKSVTILPNGKSHGLIVLLDGSGSMNRVFADVLEQTLLFAEFAKRVNIPLQAYVFRSRMEYGNGVRTDRYQSLVSADPMMLQPAAETHLYCVLDTTQGSWKHQTTAVAGMMSYYETRWQFGQSGISHLPQQYMLSQTPSMSALLIADRLVERMKTARRLEKMSVVILTDGEDNCGLEYYDPTQAGQTLSWGRSSGRQNIQNNHRNSMVYVVRDRVTHQTTVTFDRITGEFYDYRGQTTSVRLVERPNAFSAVCVRSLQQRHGARVIALRLLDARSMRRIRKYTDALLDLMGEFVQPFAVSHPYPRPSEHPSLKTWCQTQEETIAAAFTASTGAGSVALPGTTTYYDLALAVSSNALDLDVDDFDDLIQTAQQKGQLSAKKIANAFTKSNVSQTKNRVFVNTVVPFLA